MWAAGQGRCRPLPKAGRYALPGTHRQGGGTTGATGTHAAGNSLLHERGNSTLTTSCAPRAPPSHRPVGTSAVARASSPKFPPAAQASSSGGGHRLCAAVEGAPDPRSRRRSTPRPRQEAHSDWQHAEEVGLGSPLTSYLPSRCPLPAQAAVSCSCLFSPSTSLICRCHCLFQSLLGGC